MAEAQEPHRPPPDKTRRAAILATVGIVAILAPAFFFAAVVAPFLHTRKFVADCKERAKFGYLVLTSTQEYPGSVIGIDSLVMGHLNAAIKEFGGEEKTARALVSYLHWPRWIAPHRETAVSILGCCGKPGIPTLIAVARDKTEAEAVRLAALNSLYASSLLVPSEEARSAEDRLWLLARVKLSESGKVVIGSMFSLPDNAEIEGIIKRACEAHGLEYEPPEPDAPEETP